MEKTDKKRTISEVIKKILKVINNKIIISAISVILATTATVLTQHFVETHILGRDKTSSWSVSGCLRLEDRAEFDTKDTILSIKPPDQDLYRNGQFIIQEVPIKIGRKEKPSLLIKKDGYKIIEIVLEERSPQYYRDYALKDYSIKYNKKSKNIEIEKQIILEQEKELPPKK
jgi:hypothetical protein